MSAVTAPTANDRLLAAIRSLIRAEFPTFDYLGVYEYSIQGVNPSDNSIDCSPTDTTIPLPTVSALPLKTSLVGESVEATVGTLCLVEFVNADPSRPVVVSIGATIFNGTIDASQQVNVAPSASSLGLGNASSPIARTSDACVIYFDVSTPLTLTGTVTTPPAVPFGALVGTLTVGPPTPPGVPFPCPGIIGSGSTKVFG
jgi:hypothetical protein